MKHLIFLHTLIVILTCVSTVHANDTVSQYSIELNGKEVGVMSSTQDVLKDGHVEYRENADLKIKKFFMTFAITSTMQSTYENGQLVEFEINDTFNDFKEKVSGKRAGSALEVLVQTDEEQDKRYSVDINSFELSDVTPPSVTYQLLKSKKVGDETTYLDITSGTIQGIKLLALSEDNNILTASYRYFGDDDFMEDNDSVMKVTYNSDGEMVSMIDEQEGILIKQQ